MQRIPFLILLSISLNSCASYKKQTTEFETHSEIQKKAHAHWLYLVIPKHRSQIRWWDLPHWATWALFGNEDDSIFAEEPSSGYESESEPGLTRALAWQLRNPFHNLFFYVIGSADRENSELALLRYGDEGLEAFKYRKQGGDVFAGKKTSFLIALHGWKPFISLRIDYGRRLDTYIGWRERGNFGLKFNPAKVNKSASASEPVPPKTEEENKQLSKS